MRFRGVLFVLLLSQAVAAYSLDTTPNYIGLENNNSTGDVNNLEITGLEEIIPQIPKCCPLGESLEFKGGCKKSNLTFEPTFWTPDNLTTPPEKVDLLVGDRCKYGRYRLEPTKDSMDEFHLLPTGFLHVPFLEAEPLSPYDYCLESFFEDGETVVLPLVCFPPPPPPNPWKDIAMIIYPIGCLISVPFLFATVAIYMFIDELRNVQGKILSCYSMCLAIAYICLATVQLWGDRMEQRCCIIIAFMIQFFFVACFFWLNVMCYHTWRRMTKCCVLKLKKVHVKNKLFLCYSIYGWGFPLLVLAVSLIMDLTPTIPSSYIKPKFGTEACWFQNDKATLSYFYGPISIVLLMNIIFFLLTMKFLHVNNEDGQMRHFDDVAVQLIMSRRKQMFYQCLLLFVVMGMNWVLEVLSWSIGKPPQLWLIIDTFNTLQGIIIFVVFVLRDTKVRRLIWQKCKLFKKNETPNEHVVPLNTVASQN